MALQEQFSLPDRDQMKGSPAQPWPPHARDLRRAQEPRVHTGQVGDCAHQLFWDVCHDLPKPRHDVEQVHGGLRALKSNIFPGRDVTREFRAW